jgi:hypothetical protein
VVVVAVGSMVVLLRDREQVESDVMSLASHDRALLAGIVIMGLSALALAAELYPLGVVIFAAGLAVTVLGVLWKRKKSKSERRSP